MLLGRVDEPGDESGQPDVRGIVPALFHLCDQLPQRAVAGGCLAVVAHVAGQVRSQPDGERMPAGEPVDCGGDLGAQLV